MYKIRREGELGVVITKPKQILDGVYIPTVAKWAYQELEELIELANKTLVKENE